MQCRYCGWPAVEPTFCGTNGEKVALPACRDCLEKAIIRVTSHPRKTKGNRQRTPGTAKREFNG